MPDAGLRERKKLKTRKAIVEAAMRLFDRRGFEATTINEIAAAADIAPRTFFAYFPSKEAVVFHGFEEVHDRFAEHLRDRAPGQTVFDALRSWVAETLTERDLMKSDLSRRDLIRRTPSLQAQDRVNAARFEALVAEGVAADLGVAPDSLRARLVGAAAVASLEILRDHEHGDITDVEAAMELMDEALTFLQAGVDALRHRGGPA